MQMNEGLDTGDILLDKKCLISNRETAQTLHDTLSNIGANAILETLNMLPTLKARPQQNNDATYAEKVTKDEAQIDRHQSADQISRVIRAFNPRPIAYTNAMAKQFKNRVLRIIEAEVVVLPSVSILMLFVKLVKIKSRSVAVIFIDEFLASINTLDNIGSVLLFSITP